MNERQAMAEAICDAADKWFELAPEDIGWNLRRQFRVPEHIAAAIVRKFKARETLARADRTMLDSMKARVAWLESKVDPELLKPKPRETVSCKPPPEASD